MINNILTNPVITKIAVAFGSIILAYIYYCYSCYLTWERDFGAARVSRRQKASPSNKMSPDIIGSKKSDQKLSTKASRTNSLTPSKLRETIEAASLTDDTNKKGSLSHEKAVNLDMDHVYVPLLHYIWALTFIGPQAGFLWISGLCKLAMRKWLCKVGIVHPKPYNPAEIVGRLCLEGTMAIHYSSMTKDKKVAGFSFSNFPTIDADGNAKICDLFVVYINLETKCMVEAKLDDVALTADEALILCWFNTIASNHVKLHALANWGINNEAEAWKHDSFVARSSLVTVMYNYFGYTCFGGFFQGWSKLGFLTDDCSPAWNTCVNTGIEEGIVAHHNIRDLQKHSKLVNFIIKTRAIFMSEFVKHKDSFPGIDGEAFFVGTVMHSLDHTCMDNNLDDPMWLDVNHPKFGRMAEVGRIVKVGFVQDVPGLIFEKRFKGSKHPFYESVYRKAAKIDKYMADNMDTCIIK